MLVERLIQKNWKNVQLLVFKIILFNRLIPHKNFFRFLKSIFFAQKLKKQKEQFDSVTSEKR